MGTRGEVGAGPDASEVKQDRKGVPPHRPFRGGGVARPCGECTSAVACSGHAERAGCVEGEGGLLGVLGGVRHLLPVLDSYRAWVCRWHHRHVHPGGDLFVFKRTEIGKFVIDLFLCSGSTTDTNIVCPCLRVGHDGLTFGGARVPLCYPT